MKLSVYHDSVQIQQRGEEIFYKVFKIRSLGLLSFYTEVEIFTSLRALHRYKNTDMVFTFPKSAKF